MERATIHHQGSSAVVVANDPRPLMQAVDGVAREYGWAVNYEDPPYQSKYDLVDIVDPNWLAARPGMTRAKIPAGGSFQSIWEFGLYSGRQNWNEPPFLPVVIVSERSSPSRVRCAAPERTARP